MHVYWLFILLSDQNENPNFYDVKINKQEKKPRTTLH